MAESYDWHYGEYAWWAWPVWSTCEEHCTDAAVLLCADCESYMRYCALSEAWTDAVRALSKRSSCPPEDPSFTSQKKRE